MKPKNKYSEKVVHANLGFKTKLQQILSEKKTLASVAQQEPSTKLKKPVTKTSSIKKGLLLDNSSKKRMQGVNLKKERKIHPNQIKNIEKRKLMLKTKKTNNFNTAITSTMTRKTPYLQLPAAANPSSKVNNPRKPHTMTSGSTLFSMFDKPDEYNKIRSGKQFVKPAIVPESSNVKNTSQKTKNSSNVGSKPKKTPSPNIGKGNSSGGSKLASPKGGSYEIPAHPQGKLESYSPLRHFSNLFHAPVTARHNAAVRGAVGQRQIFRPQSLVMKKSIVETSIKEKSFKNALMGVLAVAGSNTVPMNISPKPSNPQSFEKLSSHAKTPNFVASHDKERGLNAIAQVESSGGLNTQHKEVKSGLNRGDTAVGRFAMMPKTIKDLVNKDHTLRATYSHIADMSGEQMASHFKENPGIEKEIAGRNYDRISHSLGTKDLSVISHSWLNGVEGTKKQLASGKNVSNHWYVNRVMDAYNKK